jgi:glycosyltransferase involved in cell wall biosynthesis
LNLMALPRRALVLANRLPYPLDDGWNVRTFHVVRSVARMAQTRLLVFHDVGDGSLLREAAAAYGPDVQIVPVPTARRRSKLVRATLGAVTRWPLHVWNQESPDMRAAVARAIDEEGCTLCLSVATFFARYLDALPSDVVRLVDTHNIDSLAVARYGETERNPLRRAYVAHTARQLQRLEAHVFASADRVWVCSAEEVPIAHARAANARVRVVPNGVDTAWFGTVADGRAVPGRLLFFGRLDYYPNVDALQYYAAEILPLLRSRQPGLELVVIGAGNRAAADAVAREHAGIRVLGRVDDVRPQLEAAQAVIVPLRVGGGTRLKIVEALAAGRPVISTSIGAEGLDLTSGRELVLADTPAAFAAAIDEVVTDPALAERLGATGRREMIARYDWSSIARGIAEDLEPLVRAQPQPAARANVHGAPAATGA